MGNHTRKCSIAGCKKPSHGRGFCISHFSSGLTNMPEDGLAVLTRIVVDVGEASGVELELSSSAARTHGGFSCPTLTPG